MLADPSLGNFNPSAKKFSSADLMEEVGKLLREDFAEQLEALANVIDYLGHSPQEDALTTKQVFFDKLGGEGNWTFQLGERSTKPQHIELDEKFGIKAWKVTRFPLHLETQQDVPDLGKAWIVWFDTRGKPLSEYEEEAIAEYRHMGLFIE